MERKPDSFSETLTEYIFTLLPFIVLAIVFLYKENFINIIFLSEWSFASAILNGQVVVKVVRKFIDLFTVNSGTRILYSERLGLIVAAFIVLLLVPSLILLSLIIIDESKSPVLAIVQMVGFVVSSGVYLFVGALLNSMQESIGGDKMSNGSKS